MTNFKFGIWILFGICILGFGVSARADVLDKAKDAVREYVIKHNADWEDGNIVVTIRSGDKFFEKYSSDNNIVFAVPEKFEITKITPNMILPILALSNKREVGKTTVIVRIEVFKDVLVANRQIGKKESIWEKDLDLKTKEVSLYPAKYFTSKDEIIGKIAGSMIQKGVVVLDWMVADEPVVSRGSQIKIIAKGENIVIETQGTALKDGQLNDLIPVRRENSREEFKAKVVSPDMVEVKI
jgi:flagella basal body P-ring formation protein FlgA